MTILNTGDILAQEGFRTAPSTKARILEAARLFNEGAGHKSAHATYRLREAFTTSDFPVLLGKAFEIETIAAQRDAVREFEPFAYETRVSDFRPKKLRDLFGSAYFEDVAEGEEYKGTTLDETDLEVAVGKTGLAFGLTWELQLSGDFSTLADFPRRLGNAATNTENRKVYGTFVDESGLRDDFFGTIETPKLSAQNLYDAINSLSLVEDHRGDLVDTSRLVLVVPPTLQMEANRIIGSAELEIETTDGVTKLTNRITNPFRDVVQVQVSRTMASLDKSANRATSWALLPAKDTATPAVVKANLLGHENVDIRVKRDQGDRVGGGAVDVSEGSFQDDTIWYRGRHVIGAAPAWNYATYASNGTA